uniref:Peptidase M3A/M3B catalytic domain-containing protein n=1 Tax=Magallana gigas TaxID=29159 RepID=A0A8W8IMC5_MAGGI
MQVQIVYSMLSQKLHGKNPLEKSTTELYAEIHNQYMGVPYVEGTAPHLRIGHLNGYEARYYSYLRRVQQSERSRSLAKICVAGIGNFGERSRALALLNSPLMSRAVASEIWQQCFKEDPLDREMGERFRREVLAHGGEIPPKDLINAMLQKPLTIDDMVDALVENMNG